MRSGRCAAQVRAFRVVSVNARGAGSPLMGRNVWVAPPQVRALESCRLIRLNFSCSLSTFYSSAPFARISVSDCIKPSSSLARCVAIRQGYLCRLRCGVRFAEGGSPAPVVILPSA